MKVISAIFGAIITTNHSNKDARTQKNVSSGLKKPSFSCKKRSYVQVNPFIFSTNS